MRCFWTICVSVLEMWRDLKFFLLHDNACPHTAAIVQQFLAKKGVAQLSYPPYLPDLTPPPIFRFPKIKIGAERWPLCFDRRHSEIRYHEIKCSSDVKVSKKFGIDTLVSILVPYNITIREISDKLKKFFERNVRNVLETLTYKFLKYCDNNFAKLMVKFGSYVRSRCVRENMNWF